MSTPQSITMFLDQSANSRLVLARANDQVPASGRIRAALDLWHTDPELHQRIDALAKQLRTDRLAAGPSGDAQVKISVAVGKTMRHHLGVARADGVPASERIRAALHLWDTDQHIRGRIDELARRNHAARKGHPADDLAEPVVVL